MARVVMTTGVLVQETTTRIGSKFLSRLQPLTKSLEKKTDEVSGDLDEKGSSKINKGPRHARLVKIEQRRWVERPCVLFAQ